MLAAVAFIRWDRTKMPDARLYSKTWTVAVKSCSILYQTACSLWITNKKSNVEYFRINIMNKTKLKSKIVKCDDYILNIHCEHDSFGMRQVLWHEFWIRISTQMIRGFLISLLKHRFDFKYFGGNLKHWSSRSKRSNKYNILRSLKPVYRMCNLPWNLSTYSYFLLEWPSLHPWYSWSLSGLDDVALPE